MTDMRLNRSIKKSHIIKNDRLSRLCRYHQIIRRPETLDCINRRVTQMLVDTVNDARKVQSIDSKIFLGCATKYVHRWFTGRNATYSKVPWKRCRLKMKSLCSNVQSTQKPSTPSNVYYRLKVQSSSEAPISCNQLTPSQVAYSSRDNQFTISNRAKRSSSPLTVYTPLEEMIAFSTTDDKTDETIKPSIDPTSTGSRRMKSSNKDKCKTCTENVSEDASSNGKCIKSSNNRKRKSKIKGKEDSVMIRS
ncbi:hypothetical protein ACOME3_009120 [Neoechinorhynchus agilis]